MEDFLQGDRLVQQILRSRGRRGIFRRTIAEQQALDEQKVARKQRRAQEAQHLLQVKQARVAAQLLQINAQINQALNGMNLNQQQQQVQDMNDKYHMN